MAIRDALAWLAGGNDRQLAAGQYAGRESATDRARSKQAARGSLGRPHRTARAADRAAQAWEAKDRRAYGE